MSPETDAVKRKEILKGLIGSTGENVYIEPSFRCDYGYNTHVGENFYAILIVPFWMCVKSGFGDNVWIGGESHHQSRG